LVKDAVEEKEAARLDEGVAVLEGMVVDEDEEVLEGRW
jgi:hypothetical protein